MSILAQKTILVTGGTGSFGTAFVQRARTLGDFGEIRILSRDELKQSSMRARMGDSRIRFYLGDVRDRSSVDRAMAGADLVFHAAALKQVPSCEFFPTEATLTNVLGSRNVFESAFEHGVNRLVSLSTDKAVQPVNAMGMSKALMERTLQSLVRVRADSSTVACVVRYGNVLASRGSVIPLFIKHMLADRPVPITVPTMTRFLLPLSEAIDLVLFALEHGESGDTLVRKSPACTVATLSRALHNLAGKDERYEIIGRRHGEKLDETLVSSEELARAVDLPDHYRIPLDARDLNYGVFVSEGPVDAEVTSNYTSATTDQLDVPGVEAMLGNLREVRHLLGIGTPDA